MRKREFLVLLKKHIEDTAGLKKVSWPSILKNANLIIEITSEKNHFASFKMVNPYYLVANGGLQEAIPWSVRRNKHDKVISFIHGDFHAENILVNAAVSPPEITVLDFDYVGKGESSFLDSSYLEASVVMAIAASFKGEKNEWSKMVIPALQKLLSVDYDNQYLDSRTVIDMMSIFEKTVVRKRQSR